MEEKLLGKIEELIQEHNRLMENSVGQQYRANSAKHKASAQEEIKRGFLDSESKEMLKTNYSYQIAKRRAKSARDAMNYAKENLKANLARTNQLESIIDQLLSLFPSSDSSIPFLSDVKTFEGTRQEGLNDVEAFREQWDYKFPSEIQRNNLWRKVQVK